MVMMEYAAWLQSRTEQDSLDEFLMEFLEGKSAVDIVKDLVYEMYMQAKAYGHLIEDIKHLQEVVHGQKDASSHKTHGNCGEGCKKRRAKSSDQNAEQSRKKERKAGQN